MKKCLASLLICGATVALFAGDVSAATPQEIAAAQKLYEEARALVSKGDHASACPKFEASQRLDPGIGTMFNLADCYENVGRAASAWALFLEVARMAKAAGEPKKEQIARDRAKALESSLSYAIIMVPQTVDAPDLEVRRDGSLVDRAMWGTSIPVDGGSHVIEVTASGKKKWSKTIDVPKAETVTVTVSVLEPEAGATASAATAVSASPASDRGTTHASADDRSGLSTQQWIGLGVGGLGAVSLGVAGMFGLQSRSKMSDSEPYCQGDDCTQPGVDLRDEAVSKQNLAYLTTGIGGALLVGGAVLFLTGSENSERSGRAASSTAVAVGPRGVLVSGVW